MAKVCKTCGYEAKDDSEAECPTCKVPLEENSEESAQEPSSEETSEGASSENPKEV